MLIVIWAIGLISLIALTMITATHYRLKAASNVIEATKAAKLAEAGIALAKLELIRTLEGAIGDTTNKRKFAIGSPEPTFCTMPTGAVAAILVEDEGGKIDLNFAPPEMMSLLLRGLGASDNEAIRIAQNIRLFSTVISETSELQSQTQAVSDEKFSPKHAPFDTPLELDQVDGMTHSLFEAVLPYVTVKSHQSGVDPRYASPTLLAALQGKPQRSVLELARRPRSIAELKQRSVHSDDASLPLEYMTSSMHAGFLIDVEIVTQGGGYFAREIVVQWLGSNEGLRTQEWRRGRGRFGDILRNQIEKLRTGSAVAWPNC